LQSKTNPRDLISNLRAVQSTALQGALRAQKAKKTSMKISVSNRQKDLKIRAAPVKSIVKEVLKNENFSTDELSIHFVTRKDICTLHEQFFNDPSPTDCISFPIDNEEDVECGYHVLGEIFICPQSAIDYDQKNPYAELTLYLVHGLLHLLGYDDLDEKKLPKMRAAENRHMKLLESKDLVLRAL
jgi:probable rRNA maturation factor